MIQKSATPKPPKSLQAAGSAYWQKLQSLFDFEDQDAPLVLTLCVLVDRLAQIRAAIAETGITTIDRFGVVGPNRLLEHERSTALAAGRLWRELGLGSADKTDPARIPLTRGYR